MRTALTPRRKGTLWDFMTDMENVFSEFDNLVNSGELNKHLAGTTGQFAPTADIEETKDNYLISMDLPGVSQDDINIDITDGRLTISGDRKKEWSEEEGHFQRFERHYGQFQRSFQLPPKIDEDKVQARYENGVLEVLIPKAEVAKPKSVKVESGKGGLFSKLMGSTKKDVSQEGEGSKH